MWATLLYYALFALLGYVGFKTCLYVVVAPLRIYRKSRFRPGATVHVIAPDDHHLPASARTFFHEVWKQVEPLGFKPTVYVRIDQAMSNSKSFLAIFDHPIHADGAAAILAVAGASEDVQCSGYVAEFYTVSSDGLEFSTNNSNTVSGIYALDSKKILKIPQMRDLRLLYRIHHLHMGEAGVREKRPLIAPDQRATHLQQSMRDEFDQLEEVRCIKRTEEPGVFAYRLVAAFLLTWRQLPGAKQLGQMLIRRRARKWLRAHDFQSDYETIDYSQHAKIDLVTPSSLPIPDWYQRADSTSAKHHEFACETCGRQISTDTATGTLVSCPHCAFQMYVPGPAAVG